jgi:hypothetical protein
MKQSQMKRLARAVHRWLSFQRMCGRSMMFSEHYLSQPIAEFISFRHTGRIRPEFNHPAFATLLPGRPKQVDFALLTPNTQDVECVIEAKWVRDTSYPKQAILDDLLRLECFRDQNRHVRRYFLVGGLQTNLDANFLGLRYQDSGITRRFLTRLLDSKPQSPTKVVNIFGASGALRDFYRKFQNRYGVQAIPKKFKTTLLGSERADGIAVYLWQIESQPNRSLFSANLPHW